MIIPSALAPSPHLGPVVHAVLPVALYYTIPKRSCVHKRIGSEAKFPWLCRRSAPKDVFFKQLLTYICSDLIPTVLEFYKDVSVVVE